MSSAVQDLLTILDLEPLEVNLFRGRTPAGRLAARVRRPGDRPGAGRRHAARSRARPPHSLHAYFLLAGDPKVPIIYEVDRIRDGKSFTTRRVVAIQHGQRDLHHVGVVPQRRGGPRPSGQDAGRAACRSSCRATPRSSEQILPQMPEPVRRYYERERPIELRPVEFDRYRGQEVRGRPLQRLDPRHRAAAGRSGDPSMRAGLCVRHDAARRRAGAARPQRVRPRASWRASLDHALWFHRPFRADEWLLYAQDSPNMHGARGFSRGLIFTARRHAGRLGRAGRPAARSAGPSRSPA